MFAISKGGGLNSFVQGGQLYMVFPFSKGSVQLATTSDHFREMNFKSTRKMLKYGYGSISGKNVVFCKFGLNFIQLYTNTSTHTHYFMQGILKGDVSLYC